MTDITVQHQQNIKVLTTDSGSGPKKNKRVSAFCKFTSELNFRGFKFPPLLRITIINWH